MHSRCLHILCIASPETFSRSVMNTAKRPAMRSPSRRWSPPCLAARPMPGGGSRAAPGRRAGASLARGDGSARSSMIKRGPPMRSPPRRRGTAPRGGLSMTGLDGLASSGTRGGFRTLGVARCRQLVWRLRLAAWRARRGSARRVGVHTRCDPGPGGENHPGGKRARTVGVAWSRRPACTVWHGFDGQRVDSTVAAWV